MKLQRLNANGSGDKKEAYSSFLENVKAFRKLEALPLTLAFGEEMTAGELLQNHGAWHKTCCVKFNKQKVERAIKKRDRDVAPENNTISHKRPRRQSMDKGACLFCQIEDGHLHEIKTLGADETIRQIAMELQEIQLMSRIEGGDLIALEAKYHLECYKLLRNRYRALIRKKEQDSGISPAEHQVKARALVELFSYIENCVEDGTFCLKFSMLHQLYEHRLQELAVDTEINRTRLRERILDQFPQAQEQFDGKNKILVFEKGMQLLLKQAMTSDYEGDALVLAKAAKIVRRDIINQRGFTFDGAFPTHCQSDSVPCTLKTLISMLLIGANLKDQSSEDSQANLTISQTIIFNFKKRAPSSQNSRHSLVREPPLPMYIGLKLHTETRSKKIVTQLLDLGLSVSYDRVLQLENMLATSVCESFCKKGVVVPAQLRHGIFTISALDNLDHNPSSTTATGPFHGTGISLFQFPSSDNLGTKQEDIRLPESDSKNYQLPNCYTTVPAVVFKASEVMVPTMSQCSVQNQKCLASEQRKEKVWLEYALKLMEKDELDKDDKIVWSAFHARTQDGVQNIKPCLTQLLPLFYEKAATAAMIKHGMNVILWATEFLNPGQVPVIACDAPLYALAKFTQWKWPETHGEGKFIVMFGGLHIEMAMWKTIGDYLEGSGWTTALTEADIASSGTADSLLKSCHLTRTRHAHQVTAVALQKHLQDAYMYSVGTENAINKKTWIEEHNRKSPTFQYWKTILNIEVLGLTFIRAHREGNFSLHIESLKALAPLFFALDHYNYARWIPIHIRDMESLPFQILKEFQEHGHWVVKKTSNRFSAMPIDQAHEQNNEAVKGTGGAIGLTENPSAFRKWMVSGPEQVRILREFEDDRKHQES